MVARLCRRCSRSMIPAPSTCLGPLLSAGAGWNASSPSRSAPRTIKISSTTASCLSHRPQQPTSDHHAKCEPAYKRWLTQICLLRCADFIGERHARIGVARRRAAALLPHSNGRDRKLLSAPRTGASASGRYRRPILNRRSESTPPDVPARETHQFSKQAFSEPKKLGPRKLFSGRYGHGTVAYLVDDRPHTTTARSSV